MRIYTDSVLDGNSLAIFCPADFGIATDAVKLNIGESKTIGWNVSVYDPEMVGPDINVGLGDSRVFWCNHDNPLVLAFHIGIGDGDIEKVECVN